MDSKSLWLINEALRIRKPSNSRVAIMFNLAMFLWYVHVCMHSLVCTYSRSSNVKSCKIIKVFLCLFEHGISVCKLQICNSFFCSLWRTFVYHKTFVAIVGPSFVLSYDQKVEFL